jgi:signal transduction histidine kinase
MRLWYQSIATGEPYELEHRFRREDGTYRWHITRAKAQITTCGKVKMWVGSNTDIHDQIETAHELRGVAAELSETDRRKDEFLATLAHELRNPLAPLRSGLHLMRHAGEDRKRVAEAHAMMSDNSSNSSASSMTSWTSAESVRDASNCAKLR